MPPSRRQTDKRSADNTAIASHHNRTTAVLICDSAEQLGRTITLWIMNRWGLFCRQLSCLGLTVHLTRYRMVCYSETDVKCQANSRVFPQQQSKCWKQSLVVVTGQCIGVSQHLRCLRRRVTPIDMTYQFRPLQQMGLSDTEWMNHRDQENIQDIVQDLLGKYIYVVPILQRICSKILLLYCIV